MANRISAQFATRLLNLSKGLIVPPFSISPAEVVVTIKDNVGIIALNRPERLNSFTTSARNALIASLNALNGDDEVNSIIITGVDASSFSAGQNIDEARNVAVGDIPSWHVHQRALYQAIRDLEKPCIAAVDGVCVGGGMHVALCADWRIATPESRWGQPEVKIGVASIVGPYLMERHVGRTYSVQLSLSGELISGQRAFEIGLVTQLADPSELHKEAFERAKILGALPKFAVRMTKRRFRDATQLEFDEVCAAGIRAQTDCYKCGEPQEMMDRFIQSRSKSKTGS